LLSTSRHVVTESGPFLDGAACDIVEFRGRVEKYIKGYKGWRDDVYERPTEEDYKLSFPTKVRKVTSI